MFLRFFFSSELEGILVDGDESLQGWVVSRDAV